jgi:hypothetical protein
MGERRGVYIVLVGKPEGKRLLGRPGHIWENNIKRVGVHATKSVGGTDISCNFMARRYTEPTGQSYRDDHRYVGNTLHKYASMVRRAGEHLSST